MELLRLAFKNVLRHPLRSGLTSLGIAIALFSFILIRTVISAWHSGVQATAQDRLIVRNAVSLMFYLPVSYLDEISQIPGAGLVGYGNWFGGLLKDENYRLQEFAVDENYFDLYPEFSLPPEQMRGWRTNRIGVLVGDAVATRFGLKVGDPLQLKGTVFPGLWEFKIEGIFSATNPNRDTRVMYFHWEYLNERNRAEIQRQPDHVGFFVVRLKPGENPAKVAAAIDEKFKNSYAETLTETETQFVQGFISMSSTIFQALNIISYIVIGIMLLVLINTMALSLREKYREFAILKTLGFSAAQLARLIYSESLILTASGVTILLVLLIPFFVLEPKQLLGQLNNFFPIFRISTVNMLSTLGLALSVATLASILPIRRIASFKVADVLRQVD